jgi:hypothetical protein
MRNIIADVFWVLGEVGDEALAELSIEDGLDEDKVVTEEDAAKAQKLKAEANAAFSSTLAFFSP